MTNDINVGELLVKLCRLSKIHNVDIQIRQSQRYPNEFEIKLDRQNHHSVSTIDITRTMTGEPEDAAKHAFRWSLYDINRLEKEE
jgi:hypothetical protein